MVHFLLATITLLMTYSVRGDYHHPGSGHFIDVGTTQNLSTYGYRVQVPHAYAQFKRGRFSLEGFRATYSLFKTSHLEVGPSLQYNFMPYSGKEISTLVGMKRPGYLDYGFMTQMNLPLGVLALNGAITGHKSPGYYFKLGYGTGVPILRLGRNHIWLNLQLEYTLLSEATTTYLFGVREEEASSLRPQYRLPKGDLFTGIFGLWTPILSNYWLTLTYKSDHYSKSVVKSPIVSRNFEETLLLGLMYAFGGPTND
jgi:hypothetical protein